MAFGAEHVGVAAGEREAGASDVIEGRRHPETSVVAIDAMGVAVFRGELIVVHIVVTGFAKLGCAFEARLVAGGGFVAIGAGYGAMDSEKRKRSLRVVEAVDICPGLCVVAGFATKRRAVATLAGHAVAEFAIVGIFVAGGAVAVFEMERNDFVDGAGRA